MNKVSKYLTVVSTLLTLNGCVTLPDVYLIDRHTAMEAEASGEWPALEQRFRDEAIQAGANELAKEPDNQRRERVFKVLNGPLTHKSAEP